MTRPDRTLPAPRLPAATSSRPADVGTAAQYSPETSTREFVDNDGLRWTVREIIPGIRVTTHRTLLTRPGYENGWLSFRSDALSCRIAPFPSNWRTISHYELERWCMRAQDAARLLRKKEQ